MMFGLLNSGRGGVTEPEIFLRQQAECEEWAMGSDRGVSPSKIRSTPAAIWPTRQAEQKGGVAL
jgi:hypothetical protein